MPSSYTAGSKRAKVVNERPRLGFLRLLQCPVNVLKGVFESQGAEKSSHCGSIVIGDIDPVTAELMSINCKLVEKSSNA